MKEAIATLLTEIQEYNKRQAIGRTHAVNSISNFPILCERCGVQGHMAEECMSSNEMALAYQRYKQSYIPACETQEDLEIANLTAMAQSLTSMLEKEYQARELGYQKIEFQLSQLENEMVVRATEERGRSTPAIGRSTSTHSAAVDVPGERGRSTPPSGRSTSVPRSVISDSCAGSVKSRIAQFSSNQHMETVYAMTLRSGSTINGAETKTEAAELSNLGLSVKSRIAAFESRSTSPSGRSTPTPVRSVNHSTTPHDDPNKDGLTFTSQLDPSTVEGSYVTRPGAATSFIKDKVLEVKTNSEAQVLFDDISPLTPTPIPVITPPPQIGSKLEEDCITSSFAGAGLGKGLHSNSGGGLGEPNLEPDVVDPGGRSRRPKIREEPYMFKLVCDPVDNSYSWQPIDEMDVAESTSCSQEPSSRLFRDGV